MPASRPPSVVLYSAPGTLAGVDSPLRRAGVRLVRLVAVVFRPVPPRLWLARLERIHQPCTVLVTSRTGVEAGVRPWARARGRTLPPLEGWAVGPGTAEALRRAGVRRVHRARSTGATGLAEALGRSTPRTVVHFRSDLAGPALARFLRGRGHRVVEVVVYRTEAVRRLTDRARRALVLADLLVVTSPSALSSLRRRLGARGFARISRATRLVVLGERSRKAAAALGFRRVSVAPSTTAQRFTRHLLRELRDARP